MALNESFTVPADAQGVTIRTGRPDALRITVGGREVPRLGTGPGLIKGVPVSAAALLARSAPATPRAAATSAAPIPAAPESPRAVPIPAASAPASVAAASEAAPKR